MIHLPWIFPKFHEGLFNSPSSLFFVVGFEPLINIIWCDEGPYYQLDDCSELPPGVKGCADGDGRPKRCDEGPGGAVTTPNTPKHMHRHRMSNGAHNDNDISLPIFICVFCVFLTCGWVEGDRNKVRLHVWGYIRRTNERRVRWA